MAASSKSSTDVIDVIDANSLAWFADEMDDIALDDVLELTEEFAAVVEQVGTVKEYSCSTCDKNFKTNTGLQRHVSSTHRCAVEDVVSEEVVYALVIKSRDEIAKDMCYPAHIREKVQSFDFTESSSLASLTNAVNELFTDFKRHRDKDKYFSKFYGNISLHAVDYFPGLSIKLSSLLAIFLSTKVLAKFTQMLSPEKVPSQTKKNLTKKEIAALQFLGGYVLQNICHKLQNSTKWQSDESKLCISFINAARLANAENQQLVSSLTRGGLWGVNKDFEAIFTFAEQNFCTATASSGLRVIDIGDIINVTISDKHVTKITSKLIAQNKSDLHNSEYVLTNLIEKVLHLYLKIRSFSYARDIVQKAKLRTQKSKSKRLRKDLKNSQSK